MRGFRICNCLVDWICVGDKVLVNNNGFSGVWYGGWNGGFGTESEVNLIRMIRGWVGFEAYE